MLADVYRARHPSTVELLRFLQPNPNLYDSTRIVSQLNFNHALAMVDILPDGPELTAGLRKLLEAKDCFVRQNLRNYIEFEDNHV